MRRVSVWNTTGSILQQFDTVDEAEEWIEECEHEELHRQHNGSDLNIVVLELI